MSTVQWIACISTISGILIGLIGTIITIYVSISREQAVIGQRVNALEDHRDHSARRHDEQERKHNDLMLTIEKRLGEIQLLIEKRIK